MTAGTSWAIHILDNLKHDFGRSNHKDFNKREFRQIQFRLKKVDSILGTFTN